MGKKTKVTYEELYPYRNWRDIYLDSEKSNYQISDHGEVASFMKKKPAILLGYKTKNGYTMFCLYHNNREYWVFGHRLVALAFIEKPDHLKDYSFDELEVNHKKGGYEYKSDNRVSNLEWVTSSENKFHAYRNKLKKEGENHPEAKYTNNQIYKVCVLLERNELSRMDIARTTGVDDSTVGMILSGDQWKSISKDFDFSKRKKKHTLYDKKVIRDAMHLLEENEKLSIEEKLSYSEIGRRVGMSRTSVYYLYMKNFK